MTSRLRLIISDYGFQDNTRVIDMNWQLRRTAAMDVFAIESMLEIERLRD